MIQLLKTKQHKAKTLPKEKYLIFLIMRHNRRFVIKLWQKLMSPFMKGDKNNHLIDSIIGAFLVFSKYEAVLVRLFQQQKT